MMDRRITQELFWTNWRLLIPMASGYGSCACVSCPQDGQASRTHCIEAHKRHVESGFSLPMQIPGMPPMPCVQHLHKPCESILICYRLAQRKICLRSGTK